MKAKAQLELFQHTAMKELAQHNYLITAKYQMGVVETRIFISMLARINRTDTEFNLIKIPITEVITNQDGDGYTQLKKAAKNLSGFRINTRILDKDNFDYITIIERVKYTRGDPYIYAMFTNSAKPYLLQLAGNFTTAQLQQLIHFRNPHTPRIYWLLRMLYNTDHYKMSVSDLKTMLLGEEGLKMYEEYKDFRRRILTPVINELANSDCPVEIIEEKTGRAFTHITFKLKTKATANAESLLIQNELFNELLSLQISLKVIMRMNDCIKNSEFDEGYIKYVIKIKKEASTHGKIKKLAGAITDAVLKKYLLTEYKHNTKPLIYKPPKEKEIDQEINKEILISHKDLQGMYNEAIRKNRTQSDFSDWVNDIYIKEGFERIKILDTWYISKKIDV